MNRTQRSKLEGLTQKYLFAESEIRKIQADLDSYKQEMIEIFDECKPDEDGKKQFTVGYLDYLVATDVTVTRYDQERVNINEQKIQEVLSGKKWKSLCDKSLEIDLDEMREVIRENPEIRPLLKRFIHSRYDFSKDKFLKALKDGSINAKKLKGCFDINVTKCIRFNKKVKKQ